MKSLLFVFFIGLFASCNFSTTQKTSDVLSEQKNSDSSDVKIDALDSAKVWSTDYEYLGDSLFHGHKDVLAYYVRKYTSDTSCHSGVHVLEKASLKEFYEGVQFIGDINHNIIPDSVFVLEPFNYCTYKSEVSFDGQAYYFTDTALPRLQTESYCCHPKSLFLVGDIDEDGVSEIGQYFSSCVSRYKSLYVFSLKNDLWKEVGHCVYDIYYADSSKPFTSFVRKTGKNRFEMLEMTDLRGDGSNGKPVWLKYSMKSGGHAYGR